MRQWDAGRAARSERLAAGAALAKGKLVPRDLKERLVRLGKS